MRTIGKTKAGIDLVDNKAKENSTELDIYIWAGRN